MINKMKEVAEMLGLNIDEEFDIMIRENEPSNYNPFKIREQGLVDKDCVLANDYLNELLIGNFEIIKKSPWKPKYGEWFWIVKSTGRVISIKNLGAESDAGLIKFGNCFKTEADAAAHADEIVKKIKEVLE